MRFGFLVAKIRLGPGHTRTHSARLGLARQDVHRVADGRLPHRNMPRVARHASPGPFICEAGGRPLGPQGIERKRNRVE
jgi:hypothetical protein